MSNRVSNGSAVNGLNQVAAAVSIGANGIVATYTCPAGRQAVIRAVTFFAAAAGAVYQVVATIGGVTVVYAGASTQQFLLQAFAPLNAGDSISLKITAGAATTADIGFWGEEFLAA